MIARRLGQWIHELRYEIKPLDERLRHSPTGEEVQRFYLIKDIFTIRDSSWDDAEQVVGGAEPWAREQYLQDWEAAFATDDIGHYPHIFTRVETPQGLPIRNKTIMAWDDHFERIFDRDFLFLDVEIEPHSGWGHLELTSAAMYDPKLEQGPWCIKPMGFAESVEGLGLPRMLGISSFVIWVELPIDEFNNVAPLRQTAPLRSSQVSGEFQNRLTDLARINQLIYFNPDATIQRKIIEDGFVPNSGEFEMEFNQARFVGQQAQNLHTGEMRVYFVKRNQWHQVQWVRVKPQ